MSGDYAAGKSDVKEVYMGGTVSGEFEDYAECFSVRKVYAGKATGGSLVVFGVVGADG